MWCHPEGGNCRDLSETQVVVLEEGDSIYFDSSIPHRWDNMGEGEMKAIWAITPLLFNKHSAQGLGEPIYQSGWWVK